MRRGRRSGGRGCADAERMVPAPRPEPGGAAAGRAAAPTVAAHLLEPHPSLPLAPVHSLRPGRVVAARTATPAGWQHSAVVGLDDDDIGFADIDEYQPRRVVNG